MRSIWKGHIRFLLVAIPVRIYNAIEASEKIQFNQLHREDFGPIGYDKRCKKCNEVVTNDEITKGYQYEPDRYAIVEPDDIAKIKIKTVDTNSCRNTDCQHRWDITTRPTIEQHWNHRKT